MQPEIKSLPANGIEPKKQPTPFEQWDHLAFTLIYQELNDTGIRKQKIKSCQRISAQLVRGFRARAKAELQKEATKASDEFQKLKMLYRGCPWYKFRLKRQYRKFCEFYRGQMDSANECIFHLDHTGIK